MRKQRHFQLSFLKGSRGMSMVTVIVAFTIMMILIAMYSQVVRLSQNMLAGADARRRDSAALMEKYYTGDSSLTEQELTPDSHEFSMTDETGKSSFTFPSSLYSYSDGEASLYSFGRHTTPSVSGG